MIEVVLIIQLFFAANDQTPQRMEVPVASVEECIEHATKVLSLRTFQGKEIRAIGAGCFAQVVDKPA